MVKKVIAVFENDVVNRFIDQRMLSLQAEKVEFYVFDHAEEGLEVASKVSFDFAFIDLHFQGVQYRGIEIAKRLKEISESTLLVCMTTLIQKRDTELAISEGFKTCLEKPLPFYNIDKLLSELGLAT